MQQYRRVLVKRTAPQLVPIVVLEAHVEVMHMFQEGSGRDAFGVGRGLQEYKGTFKEEREKCTAVVPRTPKPYTVSQSLAAGRRCRNSDWAPETELQTL